MPITTISARDFARDLARAKRTANTGPVFITDRGSPRYVLQTVEHYYQSTTGKIEPTLLEAMHAIPSEPIDFAPLKMRVRLEAAEFDEDDAP